MKTKLMTNKIVIGWAVVLATMIGAPGARAQEQQGGVARISLIHGDVSTQRGDSGEWGAATVNTPVVAGDHISTGTRSRAEVQLDYANILRMDERANVKIAELSRTRAQIQVAEGLINYTVLKSSESEVEIDTSNVAIRPVRGEGNYRILVVDDQTRVIVRNGELEITTPQGSTQVKKDQEIDIRGRDNPEFQIVDAPGHDDWDNWNKDRDHQIQDAESWHHTNRYYSGTEDLDHSGRWANVPGYGDVWQPAVSADWAPYRDGRWVWEPYYGWTWVSYEPWGWAPYHYGRWFFYGNAWSWWPGPVYSSYYPVWAPAYVSFFGFGRHFGVGVGFGFGSVGWLPIGPSDSFYPWWGGHRREFNVVNVTNITNVRNGFGSVAPLGTGRPTFSNLNGVTTNAHLQRGITAMPTEKFGHSAVAHNTVPVSAAEIRQGGMVAGNLPLTPTKESLRATDRRVNSSSLPNQTGRPEHYFTKSQSTFTPQPQAQQRAQSPAQNQGAARPSVPESRAPQQRETNRPAVSTPSPAARPATPPQSGGWQRFTPQQESRSSSTGRPPIMERGQSRNSQSSMNSSPSASRQAPQSDYRPAPRTEYRPAPRTEYRPPLDLHRSIVTPRSSSSYDGNRAGSYGGGSRGGGATGGGGSYGGNSRDRGSYSGGRSSAPVGSRGSSGGGSYGGSSRGGGSTGGGHSSAPSGRSRGGSSSGGSSHPPHN